MQKRTPLVLSFLVFLFVSIVILGFSRAGFLGPVEPFFQTFFAPVQASIYQGYSALISLGSNSKLKNLEDQNTELTKKLISQEELQKDNNALRDQFDTKNIKSANLIPARVVGAPGFIPGISVPENYVIDKGEADGVEVGDAVIYKDFLVGIIVKTGKYLSSVQLITNSSSSFTAKTLQTGALGVVEGEGGGNMILGNVVLSDTLKVGDTVLSKGSVDVNGNGLLPDLIVGKITAISKNPSDLFQKAKVVSNIDFSVMDEVYVTNFR